MTICPVNETLDKFYQQVSLMQEQLTLQSRQVLQSHTFGDVENPLFTQKKENFNYLAHLIDDLALLYFDLAHQLIKLKSKNHAEKKDETEKSIQLDFSIKEKHLQLLQKKFQLVKKMNQSFSDICIEIKTECLQLLNDKSNYPHFTNQKNIESIFHPLFTEIMKRHQKTFLKLLDFWDQFFYQINTLLLDFQIIIQQKLENWPSIDCQEIEKQIQLLKAERENLQNWLIQLTNELKKTFHETIKKAFNLEKLNNLEKIEAAKKLIEVNLSIKAKEIHFFRKKIQLIEDITKENQLDLLSSDIPREMVLSKPQILDVGKLISEAISQTLSQQQKTSSIVDEQWKPYFCRNLQFMQDAHNLLRQKAEELNVNSTTANEELVLLINYQETLTCINKEIRELNQSVLTRNFEMFFDFEKEFTKTEFENAFSIVDHTFVLKETENRSQLPSAQRKNSI